MSALHRFLVEFDLDRPELPRGAWPLLGREALPTVVEPDGGVDGDPDVEADFDADIDAGFDAGLGMGLGTDPGMELAPPLLLLADVDPMAEPVGEAPPGAGEALSAALADLAERHAAEIAELRAVWTAEQAIVLADGFRTALQAVEDGLAEAAGAVLEPLIGPALRVAAVADLRTAIGDLVLSGTGGRLAVAGPADLLDAVAAALGEAGVDASGLDFTPSEAVEVSVTADNSAIETRLGAWARMLQRRLEDRS